ncbi:sugar diacid recognition domain-containing protein [Nocardioides sambongensis]|uniref:sugar diacid recognition domain-containing protein n=1 Tax=Nocardioides sambongensis TaxID=2589074 RepID=UPI0015E8459C|nr:sugar diacid recognition domain-containing protein [Nocardioides sambongensis]
MNPLTADVAQRIVERTSTVIGRNVNVMSERGVILASSDPDRLRHQHEGALVAAQGDRVVAIEAAEAHPLRGVQPGVNVPLHHRGAVVGVVGISGAPEEVQVLADLIRVTAELILEQSGELESGQRLQQDRDDLLVEILEGRVDHAPARRRAADLGVDLDLPRHCAVVRPADDHGTEAVRTVQWTVGHLPDVLHTRSRTDELAVWWPADSSRSGAEVRQAITAHPTALVAAESDAFGGEDGLRQAWLAALDTLAVSHLADELYDVRDLPFVALLCGLRGDRRADAVSAPWRALLAADRHGELRTTLRAWIEHDLHPGDCAAALHVHRNTLRGRLARIEAITGLDLRRVPHLLQLYLGPLLAGTGDNT